MRPDDRRYHKTHEWAKLDGDVVLIGLTDHAVNELCNGNEGDLVYCDLPEVGRVLEEGESFGEIESVKAVSDLNTPIAGEVVDVNPAIEDHLEILSTDPWNQGWLIKIRPTFKATLDQMMNASAYEAFISQAAH